MSLYKKAASWLCTATLLLSHHAHCQQDVEGNQESEGKEEGLRSASSTFMDKGHLDIHLNEHVGDLMSVIEASDRLSLVYIFHSGIEMDQHGQNWRILDEMFLKVLEELNGGYVDTYAIDCAVEHEEIDPKINL